MREVIRSAKLEDEMIRAAKLELAAWCDHRYGLKRGEVLAILFAYIHRLTTGKSVEEVFFTKPADYEI